MDSEIEFDLDEEFEWVDADVINEIDSNSTSDTSKGNNHKNENTSKTQSENDTNLYRFIAALKQAEYSFYSRDISSSDLPFLSENLSSNLRLAKSIAEQFDYKLNNLTHLYYFNILLRQVSYLSSAASNLGTQLGDLLEDQKYIEKIKGSNIDGVVILEDELATNEVSMHLKSVLVPYSLYFDHTICSNFADITLDWYLELVIEITKTIATKWNKGLNINKRHLLFISSLDTVARFVMNHIYSYLQESIQKRMVEIGVTRNTIWDRIEQYDLGLNDFTNHKDILIEKIESIVSAEINDFFLANRTIKNLISKERVRLYLIEKLGDTWLGFHDDIISKLQMMNNEDRNHYFKSNSNIPNMNELYKVLSVNSKNLLRSIHKINFSKEVFAKNTKQKFSTLWGVSDVYCKTIK